MDEMIPLATDAIALQRIMSIVSIAVGMVFGYAAASKLLSLTAFAAAVQGYGVLPDRFVPLATGLLIAGESLIAISHIAAIALPLVLPVSIALLLVFLVVIANALKRGEKRPCLCFGANRDDSVDMSSLMRIILLLLMEIALFIHISFYQGSVSLGGESLFRTVLSVMIAAASTILVGWLLALPKFNRALHVLRSGFHLQGNAAQLAGYLLVVQPKQGEDMQRSKKPKGQTAKSDAVVEQKDTRRSALHKMVAGGAAFVTGLFVSSQAHADFCGCDFGCEPPPLGSHCVYPVGLCFYPEGGWTYRSRIYVGVPNHGCCTEIQGGIECQYLCSPGNPCL